VRRAELAYLREITGRWNDDAGFPLDRSTTKATVFGVIASSSALAGRHLCSGRSPLAERRIFLRKKRIACALAPLDLNRNLS
jgi:hypothetical protein